MATTAQSEATDLLSRYVRSLLRDDDNSSDAIAEGLNWYQVVAIDKEPSSLITNPTMQRLVSLRGPEWPWQPRSSYSNANGDVAKLSDDLCAGIFKGAVAVHSKGNNLDNSP